MNRPELLHFNPRNTTFFLTLAVLTLLWGFYYLWFPKNEAIHSDPESAYVASAIRVAQGFSTTHADHPGIPTQLAGSAVARIFGYDASNIVPRYNEFRKLLGSMAFFACAIIWLSLTRYAADSLGRIVSLTAGFALCFMSSNATFALTVISSEMALLVTGLLSVLLVVYLVSREQGFNWPLHLVLSMTCGLLLASKVNTLPLCIGLGIVVSAQAWQGAWTFTIRLMVLLATAGGVFITILMGVGSLDKFAHFFQRLFTHQGIHGKGQARQGVADFLPDLANIEKLWAQDSSLLLLTAAATLFAFLLIVERRRANTGGTVQAMGWLIVTTGAFVPLLEHTSWRYFLPGQIGVTAMLVSETARLRSDITRIAFVLVCFLAIFNGISTFSRIPDQRRTQDAAFAANTAILQRAIVDHNPALLLMGFKVNVRFAFSQLLSAYYDPPFVEGPQPAPIDASQQFGFGLGAYLPWTNELRSLSRAQTQSSSGSPDNQPTLLVTANPLAGRLREKFVLVARSEPGTIFTMFIYSSRSANASPQKR